MSINSEVLYSSLPSINIQRSVFDIPFDHRTTFNVGELVPVYFSEMLPGDSVKINTNKVIRMQTLLTPLMDTIELTTAWFFCPSRLTWSHWKEFMGENTQSAYLPEVEYRPPRIYYGLQSREGVEVDAGSIGVGSLADYIGVPVMRSGFVNQTGDWFLAQYARSYWMIWNEFWRDQNLQDPINIPLGDSDIDWKDLSDSMKGLLPANKFHDYFTSALKAPAKTSAGFVSAPVSGSLGGVAPVYAGDTTHSGSVDSIHGEMYSAGSSTGSYRLSFNTTSDYTAKFVSGDVAVNGFHPDNLWAKLSSASSSAISNLGVSIPNLRLAFQMQKFLERESSHGSRYCETLLSHFSIRAQDSRLQRPEYLGGNQIPLNVSQVVNSAQSSGEYLGDVGGMSLTCDSHFDVEYSAQEHGVLVCCCCARYKHQYSQGLDRQLQRTTRYDYLWPEFCHLTDQPIYNREIFDHSPSGSEYNPGGIFGYQERYAEYRWKPSKSTCEMRPGVANSLAAWHLGDLYTDGVYLSGDWIKEDKTPVDRALAVTSAVSNQLFGDFFFQCRWTRPMPVHSEPGFADHF